MAHLTTAGFSLMHTQSFDEIKNIFKKIRDKNRSPKNDPEMGKLEEEISLRKDSLNQF